MSFITLKYNANLKYLYSTDGVVCVNMPFIETLAGLAHALPGMIIDHLDQLCLDPETNPIDGIEVTVEPYPEITVNGADLSIRVLLPDTVAHKNRLRQRQTLWILIKQWFISQNLSMPDDTMIDIIIADGHGTGQINGQFIDY